MIRRQHRGAAILSAMLVVAIVATLASAALWRQWRNTEVEIAERTRHQLGWVLTGAVDWARLILREDARKGGTDHLGEPWAVPLEPAQLSTFLAAEAGQTNVDRTGDSVYLSGRIFDLQSRLNLRNLVSQNGKPDPAALAACQRLFHALDLPEEELRVLSGALARNSLSTDAPLSPQRFEQLSWLGLSPGTLRTLQPYATWLPVATPVNLNTAPIVVLAAAVPGFERADAQRLVGLRANAPFESLADAAQRVGHPLSDFDASTVSVSTRFFEVHGQLRSDQALLQERSVLQRDGLEVRLLWRERGVALEAPLQSQRDPS